jgi:tRNA-splicing ligase RtcB
MSSDPRLTRINPTRLRVNNPPGVDATLFATDQVPVESAAVTELVTLLNLRQTVERVAERTPEAFDGDPILDKVAVTPDFHKAAGVPVGTVMATRGFVVPQAIGNDINCGMRLHVTSLWADCIPGRLDKLETACRRLYFEAGRNIPMTRAQREAMFLEGLLGLLSAVPREQTDGLWSLFHELDLERQLDRVEQLGSLRAERVFGLDDFMGEAGRLSRDSQIGSIGGGNHFVEVQRVERILDGATAHAWGLKVGMVTVMVHTGSVSIGHLCGGYYRDVVRKVYPGDLKYPDNGVFVLPLGERCRAEANRFWDALHNAANFAFANRMFLALMALAGLREVFGEVDFPLVYDTPHNFLWRQEDEQGPFYVHRKGACPARDAFALQDTPFRYHGEPVLVPGSMGASSFVLVGQGNADALWSASHGAGRAMSRGEAAQGHEEEFARFLEAFRVVTPVDFRRTDLRQRPDILEKKLADLKQEAPHAYKGIGPIVQTLEAAGIATPVAELVPLMTVKG